MTDAELTSVVSSYLDLYVSTPAFETVQNDFEGQARIAALGAMLHVISSHVYTHGIDYDKQYLSNLPKDEIKERIKSFGQFIESQENNAENTDHIARSAMDYIISDSSKKSLLEYLIREINWIVISLLSASYISALVLMRSAFELIVGIATREKGGMTDRIFSIHGLDETDKKTVKDQWYRLCAWSHPYGKWEKEVCPIYLSHKPLYHPKLFSICLDELVQLFDLFLVVAVAKYELDAAELEKAFIEKHIDTSGFKLFENRPEA